MNTVAPSKEHRPLHPLLLSASLVITGLLAPLGSASAQSLPFADPAFRRVWERTDLAVAEGKAKRTWIWGPRPGRTLLEPFREGPAGTHLVQYFDKARMEINDPGGIPASPSYVTNGLLVVEMISGRVQIGVNEFADFGPNEDRIAGDDGSEAPSYAALQSLASVGLPGAEHHAVPVQPGTAMPPLQAIRDGQLVALVPSKVGAIIRSAAYIGQTGHNIPDVFWSYMNAQGPVYENGRYGTGPLLNWTSTLGYPITEPYWIGINVQGRFRFVLFQAFQRRILTFSPDNPEGWKVEMGNVGAQYYAWRYETPTLACNLMPIRGFGKVWAEHRNVQRGIRCPFRSEQGLQTKFQPFEHGAMMYADLSGIIGRSSQARPIYVFFDDGTFQQFDDSWHEGDPVNSGLTPPAGKYEPEKGFGKLWREGTGARIRQRLGWATQPAKDGPGAYQRFEQGEMFWTGTANKIYVLYGSGYNWPYPPDRVLRYSVYDDTYTP